MKTLYLECRMGAAGDMLMSALYELLEDKHDFVARMNALPLPGVRLEAQTVQKCGVRGTHIRVNVHGEEESYGGSHSHDHSHDHPHVHAHDHGAQEERAHADHHAHYTYQSICELIETMAIPEEVRRDAYAVYRLIGEAESHAHGTSIDQIHFHEVGSLDAVADVIGCCMAIHLIGADRITVSPIRLGKGSVRCAHGVLPVPAPATAHILQGVPVYAGDLDGEMCTPTGAALLRHFAAAFEEMPLMAVQRIGYGMGTRDFEAANCVRAFLGECGGAQKQDEIIELCCNLDDMTPEAVGYAEGLLFEAGALDVFTVPIQMKKSRPGTMMSVLCAPPDEEKLSLLILRETTTIGVRRKVCTRRVLISEQRVAETPYGNIRLKHSSGWGIEKEKPEYEDVAAAAQKNGVTLETVCRAALAAGAHHRRADCARTEKQENLEK